MTNNLFVYFLMGVLLGGVSGVLYIVWALKNGTIQVMALKDYFSKLLILWIIVIFVVILGLSVFK